MWASGVTPGKDRRLVVETCLRRGRSPATGGQRGPIPQRAGYLVLDPAALSGADQRPHLHIRIGGITHPDRTGQRDEPVNDLIVHRLG